MRNVSSLTKAHGLATYFYTLGNKGTFMVRESPTSFKRVPDSVAGLAWVICLLNKNGIRIFLLKKCTYHRQLRLRYDLSPVKPAKYPKNIVLNHEYLQKERYEFLFIFFFLATLIPFSKLRFFFLFRGAEVNPSTERYMLPV